LRGCRGIFRWQGSGFRGRVEGIVVQGCTADFGLLHVNSLLLLGEGLPELAERGPELRDLPLWMRRLKLRPLFFRAQGLGFRI